MSWHCFFIIIFFHTRATFMSALFHHALQEDISFARLMIGQRLSAPSRLLMGGLRRDNAFAALFQPDRADDATGRPEVGGHAPSPPWAAISSIFRCRAAAFPARDHRDDAIARARIRAPRRGRG